ncbi:MAG: hypothetical protein K0Q51_1104 [Rickettsiaceae bacterium]|jgi:hypothetical protein|nr:hypothetical protein [Rickettsiaceae bacterium]
MHVKDEIKVARFGINTLEMTNQVLELINIDYTAIGKEVAIPSGRASGVSRSKSGGSGRKKEDDQSILLHPLEINLLKDAINYLEMHKVVLVDIFARDMGIIKLQENKLPEIHTIVVYKNNNYTNLNSLNNDSISTSNQYIIIDPSNTEFSKHLTYNSERIFGYESTKQFIVPTEKLKIYLPLKEIGVGPSQDQFRDCIDIAVKLAFGLSKQEEIIDPRKVELLPAVQEVTNQASIDKSIISILERLPFRVKQASSDDIRSKTVKVMREIDMLKKSLRKFPTSEATISQINEQLKVTAIKIYGNQDKDYYENTKDLAKIYNNGIYEFQKLLGESEIDI